MISSFQKIKPKIAYYFEGFKNLSDDGFALVPKLADNSRQLYLRCTPGLQGFH